MMFIYKITQVNFLMSLRKYHDVEIAINDAAPYTPCLESYKNLISTATPFKFSQINIKIIQSGNIEINILIGPFLCDAAHISKLLIDI